MFNIREPNLDAAIDLSIMATKILYLPLDGIERICSFVAGDLESLKEAMKATPPAFPLLEQYLDLMQDHSAPEDTKLAAFLYLTRSARESHDKTKGEGTHETRTGERTVVMERTLAGQTSD